MLFTSFMKFKLQLADGVEISERYQPLFQKAYELTDEMRSRCPNTAGLFSKPAPFSILTPELIAMHNELEKLTMENFGENRQDPNSFYLRLLVHYSLQRHSAATVVPQAD